MHLSSDEISFWLTGSAPPEVSEHVGHCAECRTELQALRRVFSSYSGFVRNWGALQTPEAPALTQLAQRPVPSGSLFWMTGIAAALVAAMLMLAAPGTDRHSNASIESNAEAQDALLIEQVNAQISRTAPLALRPLLVVPKEDTPPSKTGEEQ